MIEPNPALNPKPRRPPRDVPDSLPERDEGTDVSPDEVRDPDRPVREQAPDSPPHDDEQTATP
jgi:hypothetical protein